MTIRLRPRRALVAPCLLAASLLGACHDEALQPGAPDLLVPGCGDGHLDDGEECDRADANSDTAADACRRTCKKATCGDGVKDTGEGCDDGNAWGGDGCTPRCTVESGQLEREPNDDPKSANPWMGGV